MSRLYKLSIVVVAGSIAAGCAQGSEQETPECTKGEMKCDPTGARELLCKEGADGRTFFEAKACLAGTRCDPATGRCPDLCGECNTPPGQCYRREGTCWNGECQYEPADGQPCDDGDPCTLNDICQSGVCRPGQRKECNFVPADECVDSTHLRAYASEGRCEAGDCVYPSVIVECPLGCDSGKCRGDPCLGVVCDEPPTACHKATGVCSSGVCSYLPDDGKACDDGNPCTENDACLGGRCVGKAKVCDSPPDNTCKDENTLISYNPKGTCQAGDCSYASSEVTCGHGCDSTTGSCMRDPCEGVTCNSPPNACYKTPGTCNEGNCEYAVDNGKACDDNDPCTVYDACSNGTCKGTALICNSPPSNTCKDDYTLVVYTAPGTCNEQGACDYAKAEVNCPSGCDAVAGGCLGDPCATVTCDTPPNDQCYSVPGICSSGNCTYLPMSGAACDDGEPCTSDDVCKSDGTCEGTPYTCSDALVCTDDVCDGQGGCSFPLKADSCLIRLSGVRTCFQKDEPNANNACQLCLPSQSQEYWGTVSGTKITGWSFDSNTLQNWTVTVNPDDPTTTVKWQVDDHRSANGDYSLYFGDPATRTYESSGERVRGTVTSQLVTLPAAATGGKLCLRFAMYKHAENNTIYDAVQLFVVDGGTSTEVWHSGTDANYGNTDVLGEFVNFAADLSSAAGKQVRFEFSFDSIDWLINYREGVYLDDIQVLRNCTP